MVSRRAAALAAEPPAIARAHFLAEADPYHPSHRPGGYLNLGTAETLLLRDVVEPRLMRAARSAAAATRYTPLHGSQALREAVAVHLTGVCGRPVGADDLVVVAGASAALDIVATALCEPGEAIVVPAPYYSAFDTDLCGRSGARLVPAPSNDARHFVLDVDAVRAAVHRARDEGLTVRAVALASPSNPVGHVHSRALLRSLARLAAEEDVDLIADEVYAGSVFDGTPFVSLVDPRVHDGHDRRTHQVWGFAKDLALPGFKVGVLHSRDPRVTAAARALAGFAPVSSATQAVLTELLADGAWLAGFATARQARLARSYRRCAELLDAAGIGHERASAGFSAWIDLRDRLDGDGEAAERDLWGRILRDLRVNVLPGAVFGAPEPGWFRLCHAVDPDTVAEGIRRLGGLARPRRVPVAVPAPATAVPAHVAAVPAVAVPAVAVPALAVAPDADRAAVAPLSPFVAWYRTAGVRSGPRRRFTEEHDDGRVFFPEALVPYLDHEAVAGLPPGARRELTVRHLYQFLLSTTHLETRVVNRGAERIANGRAGLPASAAMRLDAFKVYCDEGYHALYSLDLADQVAAVTGVAVPEWHYGGFVDQLERAGRRTLPHAPDLAALLQVIVFETLVTAVLNEVPNDPTVVTPVRDLTRDHARDEGRHHRFFSDVFHRLWHDLDARHRSAAALALPDLIHGCLSWDVGPVVGSLQLAGLDPRTAREVVADVYDVRKGTARVADVARATVRLCETAGALDVPGARERFAAAGLLGEEGGA